MVEKTLLYKIASKETPWVALMVGFLCVTIFACYYTHYYFLYIGDERLDAIEDRLKRVEDIVGTYPLGDLECEHETTHRRITSDKVSGMSSPIRGSTATNSHMSKVRSQ